MTVADLAHEAARRSVDAVPLAEFARVILEQAGQPAMAAYPPFVNDLARMLRNVLEAALVEHLTISQLAALARITHHHSGRLERTVFWGTTRPSQTVLA